MNVVRTQMLVNKGHIVNGVKVSIDYGMVYISINGKGGVAMSDKYCIGNDKVLEDENDYYTPPKLRNINTRLYNEPFGFY